MSANPSWYDVLDVEPTASADEIRTAWKSAIAELDPTDRRFRVLNQAAEVLLDPESRTEYDKAQAEASAASEPEPAVVEEVAQQLSRDQVTYAPEPTTASPSQASPGLETAENPRQAGRNAGPSSTSVALLAALAVLAAILIGLCVWAKATAPASEDEIARSTGDAQAAAEKAIVAIVSYDYRSLDDDQAKAAAYMTPSFKKEYESLFAVIRDNAPATKTIISTEVVGSSIVRSGDDRVQVFLFINTPTLKADITEPEVYKNQVTVTMEKVGDEWLVDQLKTSLSSSS